MHCIRSLIILRSDILSAYYSFHYLLHCLSFPFRHKFFHVSLCVVQNGNFWISICYTNKKNYKSLKMMKVVKGSFTFLVVTIILLTYNTGFRKDNENESIMTSLWITNNYNFKEKKIGFEGYCKWKQISLFLLSLTLHFVLILMSLIMGEPGRWFCQRAKPYALSWKPWDFFFHPCTQTSSLLA